MKFMKIQEMKENNLKVEREPAREDCQMARMCILMNMVEVGWQSRTGTKNDRKQR